MAPSISSGQSNSAAPKPCAVRITREDGSTIDYEVFPNYGDYIKDVCKAGEVSNQAPSVPSIPAPPPSLRLHTREIVRGHPGSQGRAGAMTLYSDTSASLASTQASHDHSTHEGASEVLTGYVDLRCLSLHIRETNKKLTVHSTKEMQYCLRI